jgi:hypothetical protein
MQPIDRTVRAIDDAAYVEFGDGPVRARISALVASGVA